MAAREDRRVLMEGVRIIFRNFAGKEGMYNREGDRNFSVCLDDDVAQAMHRDGWNVKWLEPREEGDEPQAYLQVSVNFKGRPPQVTMITSRGRTDLDEDLVEMLDWADITNVDLFVNPYNWEVNGKGGVKAYLDKMFVTIQEDALDLKYSEVQDANQKPHSED